jgi:hypothetical protein
MVTLTTIEIIKMVITCFFSGVGVATYFLVMNKEVL